MHGAGNGHVLRTGHGRHSAGGRPGFVPLLRCNLSRDYGYDCF